MKKSTFAAIVVVIAFAFSLLSSVLAYYHGAMEVLHSEGWIDHETENFVLEWHDHCWEWDISEE